MVSLSPGSAAAAATGPWLSTPLDAYSVLLRWVWPALAPTICALGEDAADGRTSRKSNVAAARGGGSCASGPPFGLLRIIGPPTIEELSLSGTGRIRGGAALDRSLRRWTRRAVLHRRACSRRAALRPSDAQLVDATDLVRRFHDVVAGTSFAATWRRLPRPIRATQPVFRDPPVRSRDHRLGRRRGSRAKSCRLRRRCLGTRRPDQRTMPLAEQARRVAVMLFGLSACLARHRGGRADSSVERARRNHQAAGRVRPRAVFDALIDWMHRNGSVIVAGGEVPFRGDGCARVGAPTPCPAAIGRRRGMGCGGSRW